jgi:hypothetical protein
MKDMNWPERVAYLENQLADSDRDNQRLREFIEGLPDGDEIVRLRRLMAEANAKMMILHNESISLHARLAEATGIINQRALELADTQGQLTEAKRDAARYRWLRIPENGVSVTIADEDDPETWYEYDSLRLDAAIDAAMEPSHDK